MYKVLDIKDRIRVPPVKFSMSLKDAVKSSLEDRWEGVINKDLGVILAVLDVKEIGEGKILPEDASIHYPVSFKMLVYSPEMYEIIRGEVIVVTEFGVFIRLGPLDGMVHVSQLMDDFVSYDQKSATFLGRESKRKLKEGDVMRARIISVSMGITARQVGLGALEWIEQDKKRQRERFAKREAQEKQAERETKPKREEKKKPRK
jgi:DNA-directed RNA polymerase subunit E'